MWFRIDRSPLEYRVQQSKGGYTNDASGRIARTAFPIRAIRGFVLFAFKGFL
jgi:hypothetical protein